MSFSIDPNDIRSADPYEDACIRVREGIVQMKPEFETLQDGVNKLTEICSSFSVSSRRFIMSYLKDSFGARGGDPSKPEMRDISVPMKEKTVVFSNFWLYPGEEPYISKLTENEIECYIKLLQAISKGNTGKPNLGLMRTAMSYKGNRQFHRITKADALGIGRALNFDYDTMQGYLLRVLDCEGFNNKSICDVLQMFCFQYLREFGLNTEDMVRELQEEYTARTENFPKHEPEDDSEYTLQVAELLNSVPENLTWYEKKTAFMDAICSEAVAASLDCPGNTARVAYTNLFQLFHDLCSETKSTDSERLMLYYRRINACFNGLDSAAGKNHGGLADTFLGWFDNSVGYITVCSTVDEPGKKEIEKDYIMERLKGTSSVQKPDILVILFACYTELWNRENRAITQNTVTKRQTAFIDTANRVLSKCHLPIFYPPHPLEFSMLLSIWGRYDTHTIPGDIYIEFVDEITHLNDKTAEEEENKKGEKSLLEMTREEIMKEFSDNRLDFSIYSESGIDLEKFVQHCLEKAKDGSCYHFTEAGIHFTLDSHGSNTMDDITDLVCHGDRTAFSLFHGRLQDYPEEQQIRRIRLICSLKPLLEYDFKHKVERTGAVTIQANCVASCKLTIRNKKKKL